MKQFLLVVLLLTVFIASAQERKFVLKGSVPVTAKKYNVLLSWDNGGNGEEVKVINGKFTINGSLSNPGIATLSLQEANPKPGKEFSRLEYEQNTLLLFVDSGVITVTTKTLLWDAVVKGSATVNDYNNYQHQIQALSRLESKFGEVFDTYFKAKKEELAKDVFELYTGMADLYYKEQLQFVKMNPTSFVSLYLIQQAVGSNPDAAKGEPMFAFLSPSLQNSEKGKELNELIELGKKTMLGKQAIDFTQPDANGNTISLSSFKGKYVLVDFWASWCAPCRKESPNLVKAYEKYKSRNFEILGVSLDQNKEKWLKAITNDHYSWTQVGDIKGWENAAAREYGIQGIPFNVLLDPNGVIIARNLRGEALEKKLEEVLK